MRSTYLWLFQLVTGAILGVFLGAHMVMMHLDNILDFFGVEISHPASWTSIMDRADQGFWLGFYIIFLALVLYHGFNGFHGIILELAPSPRTQRIVTRAVITFGVLAFVLGTYAQLSFFIF